MKFIFIINLLVVLVITSCNPQYQDTSSQNDQPVARVKVEAVSIKQTPIPIEVSGILASKAETNLSFKLGGIIRRIHVEEGQTIKKGQLLATLDLAEISAQVNQAQNAVDKASRDLTRIQNLYRDSVATLEQLQDLQTVHQVAQADLRIVSFNQKYARIKAPFTGKVLKRHAEQGEMVNPGMPILTVGNHHSNSYVIRVAVADKDIVRLALQDSAHLYFDAYPQQAFRARISELAEAADPRTGTFEVELTANSANGILKNGFVGKAMIFPSSQEPYYQISMDALVEGDQERAKIFTYQQQDQKAQLLVVKPHDIRADYFTVLAREQAPFSHVITEGAPYLKHGQTVKSISSHP